MKIILRLALLLLCIVPMAAWFIVKPVRVLAPSAMGMTCSRQVVCVEQADALPAAMALYQDAIGFVNDQVGALQGQPVVVFCSTQVCADRFGLGRRSAVTVGTVGTVIGPGAWKPWYMRHELIHHLQGEEFGVLRRLFMPTWLIEGMAYALSEDPRPQLAEPWQGHRARFKAWLAQVGRPHMWQAARQL